MYRNKRKMAGAFGVLALAALAGSGTFALFSTTDGLSLLPDDPAAPDRRGQAGTVQIKLDEVSATDNDGSLKKGLLVIGNSANVNPGDDDQWRQDKTPSAVPGTEHKVLFALKNEGTKSVVTKFELTLTAQSAKGFRGHLLKYPTFQAAKRALESGVSYDHKELTDRERRQLEIFIRNEQLDAEFNQGEDVDPDQTLEGMLDAFVYSIKYDASTGMEPSLDGQQPPRRLVEITKKFVKVKGQYYYYNPYTQEGQPAYIPCSINDQQEAVLDTKKAVDFNFTHALKTTDGKYYVKSKGMGWARYDDEQAFQDAGYDFCEEVKYLKSGDVYDGKGRDLQEGGPAEKEQGLLRHVAQGEAGMVRKAYEYALVADFGSAYFKTVKADEDKQPQGSHRLQAASDEYQGADVFLGLKAYATQYRNFNASGWYKIFDDLAVIGQSDPAPSAPEQPAPPAFDQTTPDSSAEAQR